MIKINKYFTFWFVLFSLLVCLFNLLDFDDYNIIFYITNPIMWSLPNSFFLYRILTYEQYMVVLYFISLFSWAYLGLIIDFIVKAKKRSLFKKWIISFSIIIFILVTVITVIHKIDHSQQQLIKVLQNPHHYNVETVQHALFKSGKDGFGINYLDEIEAILLKTDSREVYSSAIHALGKIGSPRAITIILNHYKDPIDVLFVLPLNIETILFMLSLNTRIENIEAGIEAAKILKYESFIEPLTTIIESYPDEHIREQASEALEIIREDP